MENEVVVVKKGHRVWKVIGILLAIAGVCAAVAVIYKKFFSKKKEELDAGEEVSAVEGAEEAEESAETFEAPADAVISNAADMDAVEEN